MLSPKNKHPGGCFHLVSFAT